MYLNVSMSLGSIGRKKSKPQRRELGCRTDTNWTLYQL